MRKWIALKTPEELNIPYFALPVPSSREDRIDRTTSSMHSRYLSRAQRAWLRANGLTESARVISTRNYDPPKTAVYVDWLVFFTEESAEAFLTAFPSFRPENRIASIEARIVEIRRSAASKLSMHPIKSLIREHTEQAAREIASLEREVQRMRLSQELARGWAVKSPQRDVA